MTWNPSGSVVINGTTFTDKSLAGVQISYGRTNIWEQPRAGYASINILNTTNSDFSFSPNQSVVVKVKNSSGVDVTVFTGKITDIQNTIASSGSVMNIAVQRITAVAPFAAMARNVISGNYAKEYDDVRMTNILTDAGITIDTIDTPGVYEFKAITNGDMDAYTLASKYAQMGFGYIYETPGGKVGYANESRRFVDARDNGYLDIPKSYVLAADVTSNKTINNLLNDVILSYDGSSSVTSTDLTSQATYGIVSGTISTELHNTTEAQYQADRYITLRATPRTSLGQFSIPLDAEFVADAKRDALLNIYMGKPIQISSLPTAIKNTVYKGFVEGWVLTINRNTCRLIVTSTDSALSVVPTRWQDIQPTIKWSDLDPALQWADYEQENKWQQVLLMAGLSLTTLTT